MSSSFQKVTIHHNEGFSVSDTYKLVLWSHNSSDRKSLYLNGECVLSGPDELFYGLIDLLRGESDDVTKQDLQEIGYLK